jgi:glycerol-3-phosphate dehydrogenase (NAD(P)+)
MDIAILGAGAWGSALAVSWSSTHRVRLWTRARVDADSLARTRSSRYLPGITIPASVTIVGEIEAAVIRAELVVVATSTAGLRETATRVHAIDRSPTIAWACKGFESATSLLPHQVVAQALPEARRAGALSGPSFALEVAKGLPTAVVFAADDRHFAHATAAALNSPRLRIYSSDDLPGVELGGALKNVVAIAAGISDGLSLGRNARAALVTGASPKSPGRGDRADRRKPSTVSRDWATSRSRRRGSPNRDVGVRLARGQARRDPRRAGAVTRACNQRAQEPHLTAAWKCDHGSRVRCCSRAAGGLEEPCAAPLRDRGGNEEGAPMRNEK